MFTKLTKPSKSKVLVAVCFLMGILTSIFALGTSISFDDLFASPRIDIVTRVKEFGPEVLASATIHARYLEVLEIVAKTQNGERITNKEQLTHINLSTQPQNKCKIHRQDSKQGTFIVICENIATNQIVEVDFLRGIVDQSAQDSKYEYYKPIVIEVSGNSKSGKNIGNSQLIEFPVIELPVDKER